MSSLDGHPQIVCERRGSVFVRRSALIAITAAAVIAGAVGCGPSTIAHQTTSPALPSAAPQGQSACTDLSGRVASDQTCHVQSATSAYQIDITFPLGYQ